MVASVYKGVFLLEEVDQCYFFHGTSHSFPFLFCRICLFPVYYLSNMESSMKLGGCSSCGYLNMLMLDLWSIL